MARCTYCKNRATHNVSNRHKSPPNDLEEVCEIHYSYLKPSSANVNPIEVGRCMRCGHKSLNRRGDAERLIQHHVNYPLDITVPLCDGCHQEVHSEEPDDRYLETTERDKSPYTPVGHKMQTGIAIHDDYRHDGKRNLNEVCPDCECDLIWAPKDMGFDHRYLCPNSGCYTTELSYLDIKG